MYYSLAFPDLDRDCKELAQCMDCPDPDQDAKQDKDNAGPSDPDEVYLREAPGQEGDSN